MVNDLPPSYNTIRERLLKLAHKFANLPEDRKDIYVDQKSRYRQVNTNRVFDARRYINNYIAASVGHMERFVRFLAFQSMIKYSHVGNNEWKTR